MKLSTRKIMLKKLLSLGKYVLARLTGKRFKIFDNANQRSASKSRHGFWYVGDVGDSTDFAYAVLQNGDIEKEGDYVKSILPKGAFYDIGCNTGYFALLASINGHKAYGFDPMSEFIDSSEESARLNHLDCEFFNVALGAEKKETLVYGEGSGATLVQHSNEPARETQQIVLDDFVSEHTPPSMLMIDVEGWEYEVLKGAKQTLEKYHPIIYFEVLPQFKDKFSEIKVLLNDYTITEVSPTMFLAKPVK